VKTRGVRGALTLLDDKLTPTVTIVVAAVVAFAIAVIRPPSSQFLYDAYTYWVGALTLVHFDNFFEAGGLTLRGTMSTVVYAPAAIATDILGGDFSGHSVLVQNALLIAVVGAVLLPRLAGLFTPVNRALTLTCAVVTAVVLGGFAPYPLMDLWAVALVLLSILLAAGSPKWWALIAAGLTAGFAVNLRPAYLVPVVAVAVVWTILHRHRALWLVVGGAVSLLPQIAVNLYFARRFVPWPVDTFRVVEVQSRYAAFVVRFDGVAYHNAVNPQLFYCNPEMAARVEGNPPTGAGELLGLYARNLPESIALMAQKVASSLIWTPDTPYSDLPSRTPGALAVVVVALSVVGIAGLLWSTVRRGHPSSLRASAPLFALWLGSAATLAYSTAEARFALPLLLIGIVGCTVAAAHLAGRAGVTKSSLVWLAAGVGVVLLLLWVGTAGLSNPAPLGDVTPEICRGR
jgi:hypothetical protein